MEMDEVTLSFEYATASDRLPAGWGDEYEQALLEEAAEVAALAEREYFSDEEAA